MGCGGLLGVNAGSAEEARLIKLTYTPERRPRPGTSRSSARGSCTTPAASASSRPTRCTPLMKLDMSGAGAIFGAMTTLRDLGCRATVTGYLMCTDNMPSGTATRLGDVLTIRGGKTVEVVNADAEGRLVMADGIVLAVEDGADAIVTIATLTGAAMRTFGTALAPVLGTDPDAGRPGSRAAGDATDEPLWELPLVRGLPPPARLEDRRHQEHGRRERRDDHRRPVPRGVRRRRPRSATSTSAARWSPTATTAWRPTGATAFGTRLLADLRPRLPAAR